MIRFTDASGEQHPISGYTDFYIKHKLDGCDKMSFCVDTKHEQYKLLREECAVTTDGNEWLIKKIDDDKIDCELNFDFLKTRVYYQYRSETRSLTEVLEDHLPEGWTIEGANVSSIRRTIEFDACTDFDVIYACMSKYSVYFVWKIKDKRLIVYSTVKMQPTGEYLTSELNLKSLSFKGSSTSFATRLYCYGADGMTLEKAQIDDGEGGTRDYGLTYVENCDFAEKLVCAYWVDERYSDPTSMYLDALDKLTTLSTPVRSYSCKVIDLAKKDPRYSFLDFAMHKKITLIDIDRHITVEHQIVEYTEWPDEDIENTVTLSCVPETIQLSVQAISSNAKSEVEKMETALDKRIMMATAMLTGAFGGHVFSRDGEIFIMDTEDPSTAGVVWRWNVNGFGKSSTGIDGPYTTALTFDDTFITNVINAMVIRGSLIEADSVTAKSISQSYTTDVLNQSFVAAQGLVQALFDQINNYLSNDDGTGQLDIIQESISDIRATIDGLNIDFAEAFRGGINFVENSSGLNGLVGWEYTGTVSSMQNADTKNLTISNSCIRLSADATLKQTLSNIIAGNVYSVGLKVKKTGSLLSTVKIIYNGDAEALVFSSSESTSGWVEYTYLLDSVQSNTIEIQASTRSDYLYLADIMICEGSIAKGWTPAPNEIYATGVKVDKNGIEVYRSGSAEKTVINNTEFAGYYNEEEVFSLNKDETRTKKTVVNGELTVGDSKFIPYENGTASGLNIALLD